MRTFQFILIFNLALPVLPLSAQTTQPSDSQIQELKVKLPKFQAEPQKVGIYEREDQKVGIYIETRQDPSAQKSLTDAEVKKTLDDFYNSDEMKRTFAMMPPVTYPPTDELEALKLWGEIRNMDADHFNEWAAKHKLKSKDVDSWGPYGRDRKKVEAEFAGMISSSKKKEPADRTSGLLDHVAPKDAGHDDIMNSSNLLQPTPVAPGPTTTPVTNERNNGQ